MRGAHPINPPTLYPDAPYHYALVAPAGRVVYAAGACPIDAEGVVATPGDHAPAAYTPATCIEVRAGI